MKIRRATSDTKGDGAIYEGGRKVAEASCIFETEPEEERKLGFELPADQMERTKEVSGRMMSDVKLSDTEDLILKLADGRSLKFVPIEEAWPEEEFGVYYFTGKLVDML